MAIPGVKVERPSEEQLRALGVENWAPWDCEPSVFDWQYDCEETAYILEGKVTVSCPEGTVELGAGDLVTFPAGLRCTWRVKEKIRKVYRLG